MRGEIIESYPEDHPYESALFFDDAAGKLHVVASLDEEGMRVYVITAYEPDNTKFTKDGKTRRAP